MKRRGRTPRVFASLREPLSLSEINPDPISLPGWVVALQQIGGGVGVPGVAVASFVFDFCELVFDDAVAATEDRPVGPDLVEACPERFGVGVGHDDPIASLRQCGVGDLLLTYAAQFRLIEPGHGPFDGFDHGGCRLFDLHQEAHDAHAFAAAERCFFVRPGIRRFQRPFVVLRTPGGELSVDTDLALQNAVDAAAHGEFRSRPTRLIDERVSSPRRATSCSSCSTPIMAPSLKVMCRE